MSTKQTVDEWLKEGQETGKLAPEIVQTINDMRALADPPSKATVEQLSKPHPNRKGWEEFSKYFQENREMLLKDQKKLHEIATSFVGENASYIFRIELDIQGLIHFY